MKKKINYRKKHKIVNENEYKIFDANHHISCQNILELYAFLFFFKYGTVSNKDKTPSSLRIAYCFILRLRTANGIIKTVRTTNEKNIVFSRLLLLKEDLKNICCMHIHSHSCKRLLCCP